MMALFNGFADVFTAVNLLWIVLGVGTGYVVGVIPGLGKGTATAVAVPLTFYLPPVAAIAYLIGISKGSAAGSAVSAILLNSPGEPSSAPTAMDGYPLARQGKARKALKMGLIASVIGDVISTILLIMLAAPLARVAMLIGPVELTAILIFSLAFIGSLSGKSALKGIIAGIIGVLVSTIGMEIETAVPRMTWGLLDLWDGVPLIPMAIGMLAVAEMIVQASDHRNLEMERISLDKSDPEHDRISRAEWSQSLPAIFRGTFIGSAIGILPGLGASVASFISYGATRRAAKEPERFGKGAIEGIAASESADNAVVPASFVPLFAIGVPGSVIAAIMIGAFMIHGLTPGPRMFVEQPRMVAAIYASMLVASVVLLAIGWFGQRLFSLVVHVPLRLVLPSVIFFCCMGAWLQGGGAFGIAVMVVFGALGVLAKQLDYSFVTFLIGFVIGPNLELSMRQSIAMTDLEPRLFIDHPVATLFLIATVVMVLRFSGVRLWRLLPGAAKHNSRREEVK